MPDVRLRSIGRSVPDQRFTQLELWSYSPWEASPLLERLVLDSPIRTRSLYVHPSFFAEPRTLDETNALWKSGAMALAGRALAASLEGAGVTAPELDVIGVTTVTGYVTPGLDLLLAHAHGLRSDLHRVHFNNIGCHAAVPLLRVVADHVARRPGAVGVAVAVEICSACFTSSTDLQNVIASTLFADGAAAAVLATDGDGPVFVDFASAFDYAHIDALGFTLGAQGFRIVLDPAIPDHIGREIAELVQRLLDRNGVRREQVALWALHPGGSRIVDAAQHALELTDEQLLATRRVLRSYGNMSSPTVLFVLAEALAASTPPPGSFGVMAAFGPGLGIEAALLRF